MHSFPIPLHHLQPKALEQLVTLPLFMFSPPQNTKGQSFGTIKKRSVKIMLMTEQIKRTHNYTVFDF
jgi:hypothetical protein